MSANGNVFPYSESDVVALRTLVSPERLQPYVAAMAGSDEAGLRLYTWNTAASAAFYGPLQCCEVALRNAVHHRMSAAHGARWFVTVGVMRNDEIRMATEAQLALERLNKVPTPGRIVAELSFGFWVGLFANVYDTSLWRTDLHRLFRPRTNRRVLFADLDRLRTLRNRIAHHEPIHQRRLMDDYGRIARIVRQLSPEVEGWMSFHDRVAEVLATPHDEIERF
jgi:hypothetical protein